jgi:'Cold-shock' DNA-binding domain
MSEGTVRRSSERECAQPLPEPERLVMLEKGRFLLEGERVEYSVVEGPDGPRAVNVRRVT